MHKKEFVETMPLPSALLQIFSVNRFNWSTQSFVVVVVDSFSMMRKPIAHTSTCFNAYTFNYSDFVCMLFNLIKVVEIVSKQRLRRNGRKNNATIFESRFMISAVTIDFWTYSGFIICNCNLQDGWIYCVLAGISDNFFCSFIDVARRFFIGL